MHFYHQEDVGLQTCIGCGDQSETSDRRSSSWAEGSGLKPHVAIKLELATYVKGMNHTIMPMFFFFFGARRCVFSIYFLHKNYGNFSNFFRWRGIGLATGAFSPQGGAVAGDDSQVFARFVGGASFEAWDMCGIRSLQGLCLTLPPLKTEHVDLKIHGWKMQFPFEMVLFSGWHVNFRGCTVPILVWWKNASRMVSFWVIFANLLL